MPSVSTRIVVRDLLRQRYEAGVQVHQDVVLSREGEYMMALIERWGMVAAMSDGEDSAGRQRLRLATPEELVSRAADITNLAFDVMDSVGWTAKTPSVEELIAAEEKVRDE